MTPMRTLAVWIVGLAACAPPVHFEPVKAGAEMPQRSASSVEVFFAPPVGRQFADVGTLTMFQPPTDTSSVVSGFRRAAGSAGCDGIVLGAAGAIKPGEQQATCIVWSLSPTPKSVAATDLSACESGDSDACIRAGAAAEASKDLSRALDDYQRACQAQNRRGCTHAAIVEQSGGDGVKADPTQAAQLFGKSCTLDDFIACRYLGLMQLQGQGVPKDGAAALANMQKACTGKDGWGCWRLGKMYRDGEGVAKDKVHATDAFAQACTNDYKPACGL